MSSSIRSTLEEWFELKKTERRKKIKEKMKSDRKLIEDRVWKCEREVAISVQDCVQGMDYLFQKMETNNMWEKVLGYLRDPSDITSAFFTCKTFSKHLEQRRMMLALPKVFEILLEGKFLNFNFGWKEKKGILSMRRVSKSWKKLTDEKFLHHSVLKTDWYMTISKNPEWNWYEAFPLSLEFKNVGDVAFAMKTLRIKGLTRSSIVRSLQISYDRFEFVNDSCRVLKLKEFYYKLYQFLGIYGKGIWALHYTTPKDSDMIISVEKNYELMYGVFKLLPNLKAMILNTDDWEGCDTIGRERLLQLIRRFPFKNSLQFFGFNSTAMDVQQEPCVTEILLRCRNLKAVSLGNCFKGASEEIFRVMSGLKLERLDCQGYCLQTLRSLSGLLLPLKEIKLINSKTRDVWINASELFSVLNARFGNSLEVLDVEATMVDIGRPIIIRLPHLKTMRFKEIFDGECIGKEIEISVTEQLELYDC